jgi:hypothetical protein
VVTLYFTANHRAEATASARCVLVIWIAVDCIHQVPSKQIYES